MLRRRLHSLLLGMVLSLCLLKLLLLLLLQLLLRGRMRQVWRLLGDASRQTIRKRHIASVLLGLPNKILCCGAMGPR